MIINLKNDNGYDIIINMNNVNYILPFSSGGYRIFFRDKEELQLTWKEYDRLTKAIQDHER
jgi:hypothetical protein